MAGEFESFDCSWSFAIIGGELMEYPKLRCWHGMDSVERVDRDEDWDPQTLDFPAVDWESRNRPYSLSSVVSGD